MDYLMPTIKDARLVHFAATAFSGALSAFLAGRHFTHLTGGQSVGYGLTGLFASSFFAQFHPGGMIVGIPAFAYLKEGVISFLNLREIVVVSAAAYIGIVVTIHALNLATWAYNKYGPNSPQQ